MLQAGAIEGYNPAYDMLIEMREFLAEEIANGNEQAVALLENLQCFLDGLDKQANEIEGK